MALNTNFDAISEEDKKKARAEEVAARAAADREIMATLFNPGSPQAQQAGAAMREQNVLVRPGSTPDPYPVVNSVNPEMDAMVLGQGDAPITPEQALSQEMYEDSSVAGYDATKPAPSVMQQSTQNLAVNQGVGAQVEPVATADVNTLIDRSFNTDSGSENDRQGYYATMGARESNNDYTAKNPNSSAFGKYQFTNDTWKDYGKGLDVNNPEHQEEAMRRLTDSNEQKFVDKYGRSPSNQELAIMHQQGTTGAFKLWDDPNGDAVATRGRNAVLNNGGREGMTNLEFANHIGSYYSPTGGEQPPQRNSQTSVQAFDEGDRGAGKAEQSGINSMAAQRATQRQFENGKAIVKADEGFNFQSNFNHVDRSVSDGGAVFQGLLAGGLAMLAGAMAGGDSKDLGALFFLASSDRFGTAMNQSHRYKNIESLQKMGYTPESIESYIETGDRSALEKVKYDDWKVYPDGSGDLYRVLPNGDTEFRQGTPKWEKEEYVDAEGNTVVGYYNDFHGPRYKIGQDGKQVMDANGNPVRMEYIKTPAKAAVVQNTPQIWVSPDGKESMSVYPTTNGYVSSTDRKTSTIIPNGWKLQEKASASSKKGAATPEDVASVAQERNNMQHRIGSIINNPRLDWWLGNSGALTPDALAGLDSQSISLMGQFDNLLSSAFLDGIQKMRGFGSLSNAEGSKVSGAYSFLGVQQKDGSFKMRTGIPPEDFKREISRLMDGSLGMDFVEQWRAQNPDTPQPTVGSPEAQAFEEQRRRYVSQRMQEEYGSMVQFLGSPNVWEVKGTEPARKETSPSWEGKGSKGTTTTGETEVPLYLKYVK